MFKKILFYVFVFGLITVFFCTLYVAIQQQYRQSADDPQIAMTELLIASLTSGDKNLDSSVAKNLVIGDATSLSPFVAVLNASKEPVYSMGGLKDDKGSIVLPPIAVFDYVKSLPLGIQQRFTWETKEGLRFATVVERYEAVDGSEGFVMVARSLREVENREQTLVYTVFTGWLVAVGGFIIMLALYKKQ